MDHLRMIRRNQKWARWKLLKGDEPRKVVAIDLETSSLKPDDGEIILASYAEDAYSYSTADLECLRSVLADHTIVKVFHNALFDVPWLISKGFEVHNYTDTLLMSLIVNNRVSRGNSLKDLALKYLGIELDKTMQDVHNWQGDLLPEHFEYALRDAEVTLALYKVLKKVIEAQALCHVLDREVRALPAVAEMAVNGVAFDIDGWGYKLLEHFYASKELEESIRGYFGLPDLNLKSAIQLRSALHGVGIPVSSTRKEELKLFADHIVVGDVLAYKKQCRLVNSYGEPLREAINEDGVFKPNWKLLGANTYRMACNKPNVQGMPRAARKFFVPREGNVFVLADYSQIELRMLAFMAQDDNMIKAFIDGVDLHRYTGAMILNKPIEAVTDDERQIAKATNFGISYGMSAYGLRRKIESDYKLDIGLRGAESYIDGFYATYPKVRDFHEFLLCSESIETVGGRRWSSRHLRKGDRKRLNYPVQGSAAEGLKEALALISNQKPHNWMLVAAIHDEIVMEVPEGDADSARVFLENAMIKAMMSIIKGIPVEVDSMVGYSWEK